MDDRAQLAILARQAVAVHASVEVAKIGFIGFSQAGWVLPRVADQTDPAFTMIVGGAVSWRQQGTYYSRIEMMQAGLDHEEIERRLIERSEKYDVLFDGDSVAPSSSTMSEDRFQFVKNAYWEDSTNQISSMKGPVLAIWGQDDLNVNAQKNAAIFQDRLMPLTAKKQVVVVPNATHGLLRSDLFNYQLASEWPWTTQFAFLGLGRRAYAEGALDAMKGWISDVIENP